MTFIVHLNVISVIWITALGLTEFTEKNSSIWSDMKMLSQVIGLFGVKLGYRRKLIDLKHFNEILIV